MMLAISTTPAPSGISKTALRGITLMMLLVKVLAKDDPEPPVPDIIALPASTCRPDIQCAQPMELYEEGIFRLPPSIVTKNSTRIVTSIHTTTSQSFIPTFTVTTEATLGICEKFDPVIFEYERPTVTVWVDVTSTEHLFTSTVVEKEVTFTYTTTATDPCVREIDRPEKKWLGGIPSWPPVVTGDPNGDPEDDGDEKDEIKRLTNKAKTAGKKRVKPEL